MYPLTEMDLEDAAFAASLVFTQVECQLLVTLLFQSHILESGTQVLEPKTILLPIGNLVL